jgi:hypothetical protein
MCKFASFVLTKISEYYLKNSDSHEDIISKCYLSSFDNEERCELVRVEITPSDTPQDLSTWIFKVDQDIYPEWTYKNDPTLKERAKKALARRAKEQGICKTINVGDNRIAIVGYGGTATAGDNGTATAGDNGTAKAGERGTAKAGKYGTATAGDNGTAMAGYCGTAKAGEYGTAKVGEYGTATAGYHGTATAGLFGTATVGNYGTATAGSGGTAMAGNNGTIIIKWYDCKLLRKAIGYIGEDGIEANVPYKVKNGKFVKVHFTQRNKKK